MEYKTACRGCHGGCVHILTVEDGRVTTVRPDPDGPLNKGHACPKGLSIIEQLYHPDRLLYPLRRKGPRGGGQWERVSWDEALDDIAARTRALIDTHGAECIGMLTGTGRHHLAHYWRFANVLNTPNASSAGSLICLGPRLNAGWFTAGVFAGVDYYGATKPAALLVWGADPTVSGADGELQWHLKDAIAAGTPLVVVDPRPTAPARAAKFWLKVRPGTDGALALSFLHVIIEEELYDHDFVQNYCVGFEDLRRRVADYAPEKTAAVTRVPAETVRGAVRFLASHGPLSLEWGCAVEQTVNALQACRAIYMIPALLGSFDVPGGFVPSQDIAPVASSLSERMTPEQKAKCISGGLPNPANMPLAHPYLMLEAMKTGKPYKIRGLFINANNTLLSMADSLHTYECLKEPELFVYTDFFMTPTAELADYVLPAALWPELDELFCMPEFGDEALLCQRKLVQTGECKSDEEIYWELSRRLGLDYGADSLRDIYNAQLREAARRRPEYEGLDFDALATRGYIHPKREYYSYRQRGFATPSGKFELRSAALEKMGGDGLPFWREGPESPASRPDLVKDYPFILTTGGRQQPYFISNNRQIKSLRRMAPFPRVSIQSGTAARLGIAEGDWVWISTPRGRITQKARLVPELDADVVNCELGWWYPEAGAPDYGWRESNVNMLTLGAPPYDEFFGSYTLRGLLCNLAPNPDGRRIEERYAHWMNES